MSVEDEMASSKGIILSSIFMEDCISLFDFLKEGIICFGFWF